MPTARAGHIGRELVAVGPGLVGSLHVGDGFAMNPLPIQPAKIHCPPRRDDTLSRERLNSWLDRATAGRIALIVAEAGFGKTTLLADWARHTTRQTAWYRLEADDRDWLTFIRHLVASVRELDPTFAPETYAMLVALGSGGQTASNMALSLAREMAAFGAASSNGLTLIIDDYHVVDGFAETEPIVRELLDRTGPGLSVVIASRSMPTVPIGRIRARGDLATLDRDGLSFDVAETKDLFWDTYEQRLESDLIADLCSRTGGWAALLLLARTQIDEQGDARAVVSRIDATRGDLYEFLAEEVLAVLDPGTKRFLTRASVLERVDAKTAGLVDPESMDTIDDLIREAERLGLLSRPDLASAHQFHPLVREFLSSALEADLGPSAVSAIHRTVALALEAVDWHGSAWHFREAGMPTEAARVVDSAISMILATGQVGRSRPFLDGSAGSVDRPGALILRSRLEIERGGLVRAVELAQLGALRAQGTELAGLAHRNLSATIARQGFSGRSVELALQALASPLDTEERLVAEATMVTSQTQEEGDFQEAADFLRGLATAQEASGLHRYSAVTRLNLSVILLWMGAPAEAAEQAKRAEANLVDPPSSAERIAATAVRTAAAIQLGDVVAINSLVALVDAATTQSARDEAAVEATRLLVDYGSLSQAVATSAAASDQSMRAGYRGSWAVSRATVALRQGRLNTAEEALNSADGVLHDAAGKFRLGLVGARIAAARNEDPSAAIAELHRIAQAQRSTYCTALADLLRDVTSGEAARAIRRLMPGERHLLSVLAEEVVRAIPVGDDDAMRIVEAEAQLRPDRWASALLLEVEREPAVARLLVSIGSPTDLRVIREAAARTKWLRGPATEMARRLAPRVLIRDLGSVSVRIGDRLPSRPIRRKVLALLCYLSVRPGMAATRDEALDAIWADLGPDTAVNSLHQTIYFLRRVIEPEYREGLSARYIDFDGEIVTLDKDLVGTTSHECWVLVDQARMGRRNALRNLLETYTGTYALDFAYEEWAATYRDTLHAAVLGVAEAGIAAAVQRRDLDDAVEFAQRILAIDPHADAVELELLRAYKSAGRHAAAAEQYGHYASRVREDLGADPPAFDEI